MLQGRGVHEQDMATGTHVAVVNQAFARRFFKGKQLLGEHFGLDRPRAGEFEIVGVAENTKYANPSEPVRPMYFTPIAQATAYTNPEELAGENAKHFATNLIVHYRGRGHLRRTCLLPVQPRSPRVSGNGHPVHFRTPWALPTHHDR